MYKGVHFGACKNVNRHVVITCLPPFGRFYRHCRRLSARMRVSFNIVGLICDYEGEAK